MFSNAIYRARMPSFALCSAALILGACEAALTYGATVGINWALLVVGAATAMVICSWHRAEQRRPHTWTLLGLSALLAAALAVTADPYWQFLVMAAAVMCLSVQVLGLLGHRTEAIGATTLAVAPFKTALGLGHESVRRTEELFEQFRAEAGLRVIRAVVLALPVALVLALLLSGADPTLAAWREALVKALSQISILPHAMWFAVLSALTLGVIGLALHPRRAATDESPLQVGGLQFSRADQLAVLGAAATVFAGYLTLQLSYLFGNTAAVVGNHVTYAQAVHRGFVELNAAITVSTLVIIALLGRTAVKPLSRSSKAVALALIVESQILAVSAGYRVGLYESAYGYTEQRLLVGTYAGAAILVLALLGWEIMSALNFQRLARRTGALGILILCGLVLWNHEAWIVRANLARYRLTGQLDTNYLLYDLGPDALPELAHRLPSMDASLRTKIEGCLQSVGFRQCGSSLRYQWYEWTVRRAALHELFAQSAHLIECRP